MTPHRVLSPLKGAMTPLQCHTEEPGFNTRTLGDMPTLHPNHNWHGTQCGDAYVYELEGPKCQVHTVKGFDHGVTCLSHPVHHGCVAHLAVCEWESPSLQKTISPHIYSNADIFHRVFTS